MNLVLLGPPGAGKGTLAVQLAQKLGLVHLSTGDVLREEVARGTALGRQAGGYMQRGELVPDDIVLAMVRERVDTQRGVLLDGFPRTLAQARGLESFLKLDKVVYLAIAKEEVVRRLSSRRVCRQCGAVYNLVTQPPKRPNRCDRCGGELVVRPDDHPEVVARRYEVYQRESAPLVDYYRRQNLLVEVNAAQAPEAVLAEALAKLAL